MTDFPSNFECEACHHEDLTAEAERLRFQVARFRAERNRLFEWAVDVGQYGRAFLANVPIQEHIRAAMIVAARYENFRPEVVAALAEYDRWPGEGGPR